jgi:hypothetical protein
VYECGRLDLNPLTNFGERITPVANQSRSILENP